MEEEKKAGHWCYLCGRMWAAYTCYEVPRMCSGISVACPPCGGRERSSPWCYEGEETPKKAVEPKGDGWY